MEDRGFEGGLVLVGYSLHLVVVDCMVDCHGNPLGHLDCHLCLHGEGRRRAEAAGIEVVAARIRTADVAAGGLMEEDREAAEGEEGSCIAGHQPSCV